VKLIATLYIYKHGGKREWRKKRVKLVPVACMLTCNYPITLPGLLYLLEGSVFYFCSVFLVFNLRKMSSVFVLFYVYGI
jgi:hypothetical protein